MNASTLYAIASLALAQQPAPEAVTPNLVVGFAYVESSYREHVRGDNGAAWGLYQFHRPRWEECGGRPDEFGRADARRQTEVMITALRRYHRANQRKQVDWIRAAGTAHNIGHIRDVETEYVRKLRRAVGGN